MIMHLECLKIHIETSIPAYSTSKKAYQYGVIESKVIIILLQQIGFSYSLKVHSII